MTMTAAEIAELLSGDLHGNPAATVDDVSSMNQPKAGTLSFLTDMRDVRQLESTPATIVLIPRKYPAAQIISPVAAFIGVDDPFAAFMQLIGRFRKIASTLTAGISPLAEIDPTATVGSQPSIASRVVVGPGCRIGDRCQLHPGVVLGADVILGDDVTLYPGVVIYSGCVLEDRVAIHAGSVIGADGFGYRFQAGAFHKLPHYGRVILEADVEIGACTTIDRGMIDDTVIGRGTKIDNQVMIGHNCKVGQHNVIVSQVGLAGSVSTGDYCRFGGQVGIADHVKIGKNSSLVAQAGVFRDIPDNATMAGSPAVPMEDQKRIALATLKLPELRQTLRQLQKKVAALEEQASATVSLPTRPESSTDANAEAA